MQRGWPSYCLPDSGWQWKLFQLQSQRLPSRTQAAAAAHSHGVQRPFLVVHGLHQLHVVPVLDLVVGPVERCARRNATLWQGGGAFGAGRQARQGRPGQARQDKTDM